MRLIFKPDMCILEYTFIIILKWLSVKQENVYRFLSKVWENVLVDFYFI